MRKPIYLYLLIASIVLCGHDLYVKMETYFLQPNQEAILSLYNGTFEKSENIITRDRMLDASIVGHGQRIITPPENWKDQDSTITQLSFNTGEAGTYVAGVSTQARNIELTADKFNSYLEHDGVLDILEQRTQDGSLDQDAVESYQKHVKAVYQVGDTKTDDWSTVFGYPIEFVPRENPYEKSSGEFKKNKSAESKTAKTSDSKPSDKSAEFKTPVAANTMPGSEKPAENENSSGKGQPQRPTPSPTKIMDGDVYGDPSGQGLADINDILPHDDYQDDEESPHIVLSYESIPVLEQTKLPRGGVSVDTKAVGRVQVRCIIFLIDHMSLCFQHKAALY